MEFKVGQEVASFHYGLGKVKGITKGCMYPILVVFNDKDFGDEFLIEFTKDGKEFTSCIRPDIYPKGTIFKIEVDKDE